MKELVSLLVSTEREAREVISRGIDAQCNAQPLVSKTLTNQLVCQLVSTEREARVVISQGIDVQCNTQPLVSKT